MAIKRKDAKGQAFWVSFVWSDQSSDVTRVSRNYNLIGAAARTSSSSGGGGSAVAESTSHRVAKQEKPYVKYSRNSDAFGNITTYQYNRHGDILRIEYPDGTKATADYNERGQVTEQVDVEGVVTRYEYDQSTSTGVTGIGDLLGGIPDQKQARGNLLKVTEAVGTPLQRSTRYEVNSKGLVTAMIEPGNAITRYEYDSYGNVSAVIDPMKERTTYKHNVLGQVTEIIDARGHTWKATYDPSGNLLSLTDPLGHTTNWHYDNTGRVVKIISPDDTEMNLEVNAAGLPTAIIDAASARTTFEYDQGNRLVAMVDPLKQETRQGYDDWGRMTSRTDGEGNTIRYEYQTDRLTKVVFPTYEQAYEYDSLSRVSKLSREYGPQSQRTVLNNQASYFIDDNLKTSTDTRGNNNQYTYDLLDRVATHTDANGGVTHYSYDQRDNLLSVTDPEGRITRYEYNLRYERIAEIKVGGGSLTDTRRGYEYDAVGNLVKTVNPAGQVALFTYDKANRLISEAWFANATAASGSNPDYQATFSYNKVGALTGYDDGSTAASYVYDRLYQLLSADVTFNKGKPGAFTKHYEYTYRANGVRESYTNPETVRYEYRANQANQLTAVIIPGQGRISFNDYNWLLPRQISYPGGSNLSLSADGLMRQTRRQVNDPAGNAMMDLQWEYDGESKELSRNKFRIFLNS